MDGVLMNSRTDPQKIASVFPENGNIDIIPLSKLLKAAHFDINDASMYHLYIIFA